MKKNETSKIEQGKKHKYSVEMLEYKLNNDNTLSSRVPVLPCFEACWITHEDRFLHMSTNTSSFVLLHMHIGSTLPNLKVRDI
jgi:hypothetical protein